MTIGSPPFTAVVLERPITVDGRLLKRNCQASLVMLVAMGAKGAPTNSRLRTAMSRLREQIGTDRLPHTSDGRYRLALAASDVDAWELLACARTLRIDHLDDEQVFHLLSPCPDFDGLLGEPLRSQFVDEVQRAQRTLYPLVLGQRPDLLGERMYGLVQRLIESDEYNENLLQIAALSLSKAGKRLEATRILVRARTVYVEAGLQLSAKIDALHHELLEAPFDLVPARVPPDERSALPAPLVDQLASRRVGPTTTLEQCVDLLERPSRGVISAVLTGESGVGKSRLCAEAAGTAMARGFCVRYVRPSSPSGEAAFGPFIAVFPSLRDDLTDILGSGDDPESRKAQLWIALADAIDAEAAGRPMLLIIDDAQWLDTYSSEAVAHLLNCVLDVRLILLVAGRDEPDSPWPGIVASAMRAGAQVMQPDTLGREALIDLVHDRRPGLPMQLARGIAGELFRASRGLPGIANVVLAGFDSDGFAVSPNNALTPDTALIAVIDALSGDARQVALISSVIGLEFDLDDLFATSGLAVARVMMALDELVSRKLMVRRTAAQFVISHALVQSASLSSHTHHEVADAHRRAAEYFRDHIHRRAFHEAEAIPLVRVEQAIESLLVSARSLEGSGLHREAAMRFRMVSDLGGRHALAALDGGLYARALDLSGASGSARRVRQVAFEQASASGRSWEALQIAVSGLPESELIDGDPTVVSNLLRIEPARLAPAQQWQHAHHLTRQLTIVGRLDEAWTWAARCAALAVSPHQHVAAAITSRFAISATSAPSERVAALAGATRHIKRLQPEQLGQYLLLLALDQYEAGDHPLAQSIIDRLRALGPELTPTRRWHSMMFQALLLTDRGETSEAHGFREAAHNYGITCGLVEAENAYTAPAFVDLWLRRSTAILRSEVDGGVLNPSNSVLARAAAANTLAAVGEWPAAIANAEIVATSVIASPVAQATAALAIASEVLAKSEQHGLIASSLALLERRGNSMIIVGAGAASLGPVCRYVAQLTDDPAERRHHLHEARALADSSGAVLWSIITRRDLIDAGEAEPAAREEFDTLARTVGLNDLLLGRS